LTSSGGISTINVHYNPARLQNYSSRRCVAQVLFLCTHICRAYGKVTAGCYWLPVFSEVLCVEWDAHLLSLTCLLTYSSCDSCGGAIGQPRTIYRHRSRC